MQHLQLSQTHHRGKHASPANGEKETAEGDKDKYVSGYDKEIWQSLSLFNKSLLLVQGIVQPNTPPLSTSQLAPAPTNVFLPLSEVPLCSDIHLHLLIVFSSVIDAQEHVSTFSSTMAYTYPSHLLAFSVIFAATPARLSLLRHSLTALIGHASRL